MCCVKLGRITRHYFLFVTPLQSRLVFSMELFIRKVKIKSVIINWLSYFGYFILSILRYFVFDVICCYVCRPQEEQGNQDGVVMAECATKYNHAESVMVVGTRKVIKAFMIQDYKIRELEEAYFQNSTVYLNTTNSDDSDCDGDDEYSEDDETENELGLNNSREYCGRGISEDTHEERFEIVSEQTDITTAKPFKPKKTKPFKPKKTKPKRKRAKLKQTKSSRSFHTKGKKPTRNRTIEEQGTGSVTDHPMYTWDGGTAQHHPIKGPHGKCSSTAAVDQGSCTTTCVQCIDED